MPIWIEAALGLSAVALCAVACWEDSMIERIKRRKEENHHGKEKV